MSLKQPFGARHIGIIAAGRLATIGRVDDAPICSVPGCEQPLNGALIRDPDLRRRALATPSLYCMPHQRLINDFTNWLTSTPSRASTATGAASSDLDKSAANGGA